MPCKVTINLCSKFLSTQIMFWNSNSIIFRILILFLESKFPFSAHISFFYVIIYNSKTLIGILNADLDSKLKLEFKNKIWADTNL